MFYVIFSLFCCKTDDCNAKIILMKLYSYLKEERE